MNIKLPNLFRNMVQKNLVKIGKKIIGDGKPIYIIGDIGLTNGGDIERTFKLIDELKKIGVDAVKFQMIKPDELLGDRNISYTYPTLTSGKISQNMYEMFSELNYTDEEWYKISKYVFSKGLEFICTSHVMSAVTLLEKCNVNVHKICTWSTTHKRLIEKIGSTKKPLIIDTGASSTNELDELVKWFRNKGGKKLVILHDFHTNNFKEMNFKAIPFMKKRYQSPVGYTPQGRNFDLDFLSIGIGVNVLEKRITLDRKIPKNGHWKSLEPNEFKDWLIKVRNYEKALGKFEVKATKDDIKISKWGFKSLHAKIDMKKGQIIKDNQIQALRPGKGISASMIDKVIGKKIKINIKKNKVIKWENIFE